ncbi:MAG: ComF family protein [Rhodothermales bacterium]
MRSVTSVLVKGGRSAWKALLDVVYPPRCIRCGATLLEAQPPLCPRCLHRLERVEPEDLSALLQQWPEARQCLAGAFALWPFDAGGTVQRIQHLLKYGNRPRYGVAFGMVLGTAYRETVEAVPDLVLPIPLHRARLYERGYNQSAMLGRGVGRALGVPVSEALLVRRRATRSQTKLSRRKRWENVSGAFAVPDQDAVATRHLLLIDDVLTTGATLTAGAMVLKQAGAASVRVATLALARS